MLSLYISGVGVGQVLATFLATSYYASVLALTVRYLVSSFSSILPWSQCDAQWSAGASCIDSSITNSSGWMLEHTANAERPKTSAELYF